MSNSFFFNPRNNKKSFNVYINKNPSNTISIKYKSITDVQKTISKLENLYKRGKYSHKRIFQVCMIMKIRIEVIKKNYPNAKDIIKRYNIAKKYFNFLKKRSEIKDVAKRKKMFFNIYS